MKSIAQHFTRSLENHSLSFVNQEICAESELIRAWIIASVSSNWIKIFLFQRHGTSNGCWVDLEINGWRNALWLRGAPFVWLVTNLTQLISHEKPVVWPESKSRESPQAGFNQKARYKYKNKPKSRNHQVSTRPNINSSTRRDRGNVQAVCHNLHPVLLCQRRFGGDSRRGLEQAAIRRPAQWWPHQMERQLGVWLRLRWSWYE